MACDEAWWRGTWLSAAFVTSSPPGLVLRDLVFEWNARSLLEAGRATLLEASADTATLHSLDDPGYRPDLVWGSMSQDTLEELASHYICSLLLCPAGAGPNIVEIRVDFDILPTEALAVTVSAPYQQLVEEQSRKVAEKNLESFVNVCSRFFVSRLFLAGAMGEELRIETLSDNEHLARLFADWAYLGNSLAAQLDASMRMLGPQGVRVARLVDGGVFVRWGDWWSPRKPAGDWIQAIRCALAGNATHTTGPDA